MFNHEKMERGVTRTVSADPGLMSPEQLLKSHKDGRRKTLEDIIAMKDSELKNLNKSPSFLKTCRDYVRWFLDSARLKISVSFQKRSGTLLFVSSRP